MGNRQKQKPDTGEKKMFVCFRRSKWLFNIQPQTTRGWIALILGVVPMLLVSIFFEQWATYLNMDEMVASFLIVALILVWTVLLIRWMYANSEIIDYQDVQSYKRERENKTDTRNNRRS